MLDLDASVDCDGSCSSLDPIGCKLVSNEEAEKAYREAIKPTFSQRYFEFMVNLRQNNPRTYGLIRRLGF